MKNFLAGLGILSLVLGVALPVLAAEDYVSATVTPAIISVTVSPDTVAYGTVDLDTDSAPSAIITATNDGSVAEDFGIYGDDATDGTTTWTLAATAGPDQYIHNFALPNYTTWTALTYSSQSLASNVTEYTGTQDFKIKLHTPTSSTTWAEYSTVVTVVATAAAP